jgi:hypothetical protein
MKIIIGIRKTSPKGGKVNQFEMVRSTGNANVIKNKIFRYITNEPDGNYDGTDDPVYDLYINDNGVKRITNSVDLAGETVGVTDDKTLIEFKKVGDNIRIERVEDTSEGALPQQSTVNQLKRIRKQTKGITIDDKISDMNKQGANIQYIRNPIDTGIESIQDHEIENKNFDAKHIFKRIKPFHDFIGGPQPNSHLKNKKNKKKK